MIFLNFFLNFLRVFGRYGLGVEFAFYFGVGAYADGFGAPPTCGADREYDQFG